MKGKIFNAQEVQAILNGSKVMFSEVIKPQQPLEQLKPFKNLGYWTNNFEIDEWICPYQVGQKIFCKEDFCEKVDQDTFESLGSYHYRASCGFDVYMMDGDGWTLLNKDGSERLAWKPAQHMKQEHSRLTLLIKSIGVERLQDISEEDAIKEGFEAEEWLEETSEGIREGNGFDAVEFFQFEWNSTHKKPEEKFEANPWVWKVEMEVVK